MKQLIEQDCLSCVYLNANGTCGNRRSVMYGVITTKNHHTLPNCAMTEDTTTRKPLRNTRENAKYKAYTTMNKLIEEAERLYKKIDKAQVHLINARLNNDEEGKKSAISEMETAMCNAIQLLKCFIERKDNIVDLGEVWHKNNAIPEEGKQLLAINIDGEACEGDYQPEWESEDKTRRLPAGLYCSNIPIWIWSNIKRWAYIEDLLPKGGKHGIPRNR